MRSVLDTNLSIPFTQVYGFKHWYIKGVQPRCRPNTTTDNECLKSIEESAHTLFVYIIRNPFDWLSAMFARPYHIPALPRTNMMDFIQAPYMAYEKELPSNHRSDSISPWSIDPYSGVYFIEESENIIELRNLKHTHFYNLSNRVKYFSLITLENLQSDVESMIQSLELPRQSEQITFKNFRTPTSYEIPEDVRRIIRLKINNPIDKIYYPD